MAKSLNSISDFLGLVQSKGTLAALNTRDYLQARSNLLLFSLGIALLYSGLTEVAHAGSGTYGMACAGILSLVEGTFGALVTAAAGIGAIIASAVGGFKMAWSLLVVAVGAFILRSYITLFNGECNG